MGQGRGINGIQWRKIPASKNKMLYVKFNTMDRFCYLSLKEIADFSALNQCIRRILSIHGSYWLQITKTRSNESDVPPTSTTKVQWGKNRTHRLRVASLLLSPSSVIIVWKKTSRKKWPRGTIRSLKADLHGTTSSHTTSLRKPYDMNCFL